MRKNAREAVYKLLFSLQFNDKFDDNYKLFIYNEEKLSSEDVEFADELLTAYFDNEEQINEVISNLSNGYKLERIYSILTQENNVDAENINIIPYLW